MAIWKWTMRFSDVRECRVEADTEEEARKKMDVGDWLSEDTINFYADELVSDLEKTDEA